MENSKKEIYEYLGIPYSQNFSEFESSSLEKIKVYEIDQDKIITEVAITQMINKGVFNIDEIASINKVKNGENLNSTDRKRKSRFIKKYIQEKEKYDNNTLM